VALINAMIPKNVELRFRLAPGVAAIEADAAQIQQLVMNLVINAAEAIGPEGGVVEVATAVQHLDTLYLDRSLGVTESLRPGTYIVLTVSDTGSGMDETTKSRIFDPFFTTKFTGRGLGLAAVLGIVRGHRGGITVYSTPGEGTTFKVLFPTSAATKPDVVETRTIAIDVRRKGTILVVDDEEVVRRTATLALQRAGYTTVVATNGKEAVDWVTQHAQDELTAILLDMTMPIMSGALALTHLRVLRPKTPVIASSGYNEVEALKRFGEGIAAFLQKPFTVTQLTQTIAAAVTPGSNHFA
jgi:CheY-like chemotaxis protein